MQNYYNRQSVKFNKEQSEEFLNYLKENRITKPRYRYASNHNPDYLTGKIGQEYKDVRLPQTYFSKKYNGTLQPIDDYYIEHRNNFNDYYPLAIFDELYTKPYDQHLYSTRVLNTYNNRYYDYLDNEQVLYNLQNRNFRNQRNYSQQKIPVSKSMSHFDFEQYQKQIIDREKQLIGNYDYNLNQNNYPSKTPKNSNYYNDRYSQNQINYNINRNNPCKIFIF
jgi:hypothetical protein